MGKVNKNLAGRIEWGAPMLNARRKFLAGASIIGAFIASSAKAQVTRDSGGSGQTSSNHVYLGGYAPGSATASAISSAIAAVSSKGGGIVELDGARVYDIGTGYIVPASNVTLVGNGATIRQSGGSNFMIQSNWSVSAFANVTANPAAGSNQLTLSSVSAFAVGDLVCMRLGDNAYDPVEPRYAVMAKITAIANPVVTLDRPIPYAINVTGATNAENKKLMKVSGSVVGFSVDNVNFEGSGSFVVQGGISITWARNLSFTRITGNKNGGQNMGAGLIGLLQFCENVYCEQITLFRNDNTSAQGSMGRMFNFSNCIDVSVKKAEAFNIQSNFCFLESYCEGIRFQDLSATHSANPNSSLFSVVQEAEVSVAGVRVNYPSVYNFISKGGTPAVVSFRDVSLIGASPLSTPKWTEISGRFSFNDGTNYFVVDMDNVAERFIRLTLTPSMVAVTSLMDMGYLLDDVDISVASGTAGLSNFYWGNAANNGPDIAVSLNANIGKVQTLQARGAGVFGANNGGVYSTVANAIAQTQIIIYTGVAGAGTIVVRARMAKIISQSGGTTAISPWTSTNMALT